MFNGNPIKEKIYNIIKSNIDESEHIDLEGNFEDIGIGSISFIKIMVEIEVHYDIEIEEMYFINVEYRNIENFIDKIAIYVQEMTQSLEGSEDDV